MYTVLSTHMILVNFCFFFFFFQAEDGIRDRTVTGVQTCALPISVRAPPHPVQRVLLQRKSSRLRVLRAGPRIRPCGDRSDEIGRASCRERVERWVGGVGL